jgi:hypothetical protein
VVPLIARRARAMAAFAVACALTLLAGCGGSNNSYVPQSVVVGDFNRDGALDIAVDSAAIQYSVTQQSNEGLVAVALQNKSSPGTFGASAHYAIAGAPAGLATGDLTGTGNLDLVAGSNASYKVSVLLHSGNNTGTFAAAVDYDTGDQPNDVAVGDLSGTGKLDIAVAAELVSTDENTGLETSSGEVVILPHDPATPGHFLAPTHLPLPNRGIRITIGDLNNDGLNDIVVTSFDVYGNNGLVSIFYQDPTHPGTFLPRVDISAGSEPSGVVIADLNGDGLPDLAIASEGETTNGTGVPGATVLLQNKAAPGTFLAPVTYQTEAGSLSIAVGDLNHDGIPDIVVVTNYPVGEGEISVLLQDASARGTFETAVTYEGAGHTNSVAIGDMTGNGYNDIVLADSTGMCLMLQSTSSPGTFGAISVVGG